MSETYKSNRNVFYTCHYHALCCPKYGWKVLIGPIETRLKEIIGQLCQQCQAEVEELVGKTVNIVPGDNNANVVKELFL